MIVVDTSALVDALTGSKRSAPKLRALLAEGYRLYLVSLVLYEWWRGPRLDEELAAQEALFPTNQALAFGTTEAHIAADLYRRLDRARGRELDLAIAACALTNEAAIWTLNRGDFIDIPGLELLD